jgi:hypothetical protein
MGVCEHVNASLCSTEAESVNQIASVIFLRTPLFEERQRNTKDAISEHKYLHYNLTF